MRVEPETILEHCKELKKNKFFMDAIKMLLYTAAWVLWGVLMIWIATTDKLYW